MNWDELKEKIGQQARQIISTDRGNADGKLNCVCTDHAKGEVPMSWLADGLKFYCHDCEGCFDCIDHAKWLAHDDMQQAYDILCEMAGEKPTAFKEKAFSAELTVIPDAPKEPLTFPAVELVSDTLFQNAGHYLTGRGIKRDTLIDYKVTSTPEAVFFNYYVGETPVKIKGRAIGNMVNGRDKYKHTPKGGTNTLYGQHMFKAHRTVAVCEGEVDALSLHSALKANGLDDIILASSIPSGSSSTSWIENSRDFLSKFEAVILVPDNDDAGKKFVEKAGSELIMVAKVRTATLEGSGANDLNELLQKSGTKAVCGIVANSREHLPDFAIDFSKLPARTGSAGYERSGFYTLDKIIRGLGHGLMTLFTGHTSAGKTTILRQMLIFNAQQKRRIGIMVGEETPIMFREIILRQAFAKAEPHLWPKSMDEWDNADWTPNKELIDRYNDNFSPYISSFNCGHLQGGDRLKKLYEWIRFESSIYDTRLFIVDNLMKLEVGMGDNLNAAQGDIVDTLKNITAGLNVHIILVAHPKKGQATLNNESVSGTQKLANTVDNVISFERFDKMEDAQAQKIRGGINHNNDYDNITAFMKVQKNRIWAKCGCVPMRYDEQTNCIHDLSKDGVFHYGYTLPGREIDPEGGR